MSKIKVVKATIDEIHIVVNLVAELLIDFNNKNHSDFIVDKNKLKDVTKDIIVRDNFAAFIAYDSDYKPKGLITISGAFAIYNGGDFGVITELYVDRTSRSTGIGKLLLESAFNFSDTMNWKKVEVGAPNAKEWPRTIEFYKKNGFKQKGPKLRIDLR
ncbi:GNAT family N-acetyltransferase [Winogradskyella sp. R77965]|uniref:GNAT family N-acetyltransferase n=1 Tax=Winogradskyella sp. R77965 TaxID=3093872 RepID=UPI0037DDD231